MRKRLGVGAVALFVVLFSSCSQTTNLFELAKSGTPQQIQTAISGGAKVNAHDRDGCSALMYAAR